MGKIYDRNSVTIVVVKDMLGIRKSTQADAIDCPSLIFTHEQAWSLWDTLCGTSATIQGNSLALYGDKLNEKGSYPELLTAAINTPKTAESGRQYFQNDGWKIGQLKAHKPTLVQLEVGFYGQPQLCAYLVAPVAKGRTAKARVIPQITRIDVASPEGQAIADKHNKPAIARINRR